MKIDRKNCKKILTILIAILIVLLAIFLVSKSGVVQWANTKILEYRKADTESEIQAIIDQVKQDVQTNESREATLLDLKEKLAENGYELDETTGEVVYNGYTVTINSDLTIDSVEEIVTNAWYEISNVDGDKLTLYIMIENKKGIERITADDITLEIDGNKKVALDRELTEGQAYSLKIKLVGEDKEELYTLVATTKPNIVITNTDTLGDGTTATVKIEYADNSNLINYYSLDNGETWNIYTGEMNLKTEESNCIVTKSVYNVGKTINNIEKRLPVIVSNSLLSTAKNGIKTAGYYRVKIKDEEYKVHAYVENANTVLENNTAYGDEEDVATASEYAKNMVIVKVNGDLTINSGVTLTAYNTIYGGPKGMLLYTTGTLTNNGTISMTARGAKAVGQNVYLWQNQDASYEYVPQIGATGGNATTGNGNDGVEGSKRQTGGGGSGGGYSKASGAGRDGTSYSGGTGGGGSQYFTYVGGGNKTRIVNQQGGSGQLNGATGGSGCYSKGTYYASWGFSGGGAGNPGGSVSGKNGTGGLLIVYGKDIINNGAINANGSNGGIGENSHYNRAGGGASGGGSINIFYNETIIKGNITANGGIGGNITNYVGGNGGSGSVSIGNISTGTYVEYVEPTT